MEEIIVYFIFPMSLILLILSILSLVKTKDLTFYAHIKFENKKVVEKIEAKTEKEAKAKIKELLSKNDNLKLIKITACYDV